MRFYVKNLEKRRRALLEFTEDCTNIKKGLLPHRAMETDIYITKSCNLNCSYCYFKDYYIDKTKYIKNDPSLDKLKLMVDKLDGKTYCLVILGGEPFCRSDLPDFLHYTRTKDIYSIRISTNGLLLAKNKEILHYIDRLSVSFDCVRKDEYPDRMKKMISDLEILKKEMGEQFPSVCLSWTTSLKDDFYKDVIPLLDYAKNNHFYVKFLPVKINQHANWKHHKKIVKMAIKYATPRIITNDLTHTENLNSRYLFKNCLQGIQYYIDFEGNFLYPCDEFPLQKTGSIFGPDTVNELYKKGIKKYGRFPQYNKICSHCPSGCHSDNSFILLHPETQINELKGL